MLRPLLITAALGTVLAATAAPSRACSQRHQTPFEQFDAAATVAIVKVRALSFPKGSRLAAGPVALRVTRMLKGAKRAALTAQETNTSCHVGFRVGRAALVFLDADGDPLGSSAGYVEDLARWQPVMDAWAAAADPAARTALLVGAITGDDALVANEAAGYLADQPALIVALDARQRAALVALAPDARFAMLPFVLARLRTAAASRTQPQVLARLLAITAFEAVTDPSALADAIDHATGETAPERIAALERCERVRATRLWPFTWYAGGASEPWWGKLAEACRTGVPAPR